MLPLNIRVDRNCQPTWVTQNAIPEEQELILLRGGHYDPLPDKVGLRMGHQFLPFFYVKSWSNFTPNGSFKICSSWRFQSTPYMLNLMKFWPRYLRLKTTDIFQKLISSSSFSLPIFSVISSLILKIRDRFVICSSWGFQNWHWLLKLMKNWQRYSRLKARPNFRKDDENMNLTSAVAK